MQITRAATTGTSAKFIVQLSKGRGEFMLSFSSTLLRMVWDLPDQAAELDAATRIADAIVGRHDPAIPFPKIYVFGDHNSEDTVDKMVARLKKVAL
jgi:hypothetical protein